MMRALIAPAISNHGRFADHHFHPLVTFPIFKICNYHEMSIVVCLSNHTKRFVVARLADGGSRLDGKLECQRDAGKFKVLQRANRALQLWLRLKNIQNLLICEIQMIETPLNLLNDSF